MYWYNPLDYARRICISTSERSQKLDGIQTQQKDRLASLNDNIKQNQQKLNQLISNTALHTNRLNTMAKRMDKFVKNNIQAIQTMERNQTQRTQVIEEHMMNQSIHNQSIRQTVMDLKTKQTERGTHQILLKSESSNELSLMAMLHVAGSVNYWYSIVHNIMHRYCSNCLFCNLSNNRCNTLDTRYIKHQQKQFRFDDYATAVYGQ
eukprot:956161_1